MKAGDTRHEWHTSQYGDTRHAVKYDNFILLIVISCEHLTSNISIRMYQIGKKKSDASIFNICWILKRQAAEIT